MFRKGLIASVIVGALSLSAFAADIVVKLRPPRLLVEHRAPAPGPGYYWTQGYHRWDGRAYVWTPGAWVQPPRPHARWVAHRWVRRGDGWVFVEGHWR